MTKIRFSAIVLGAALGAALAAPAAAQQRVSIYTAHTANIVEKLIPEFEKATGIKADVVKAGSGDIINRVRAESANPKADVIWSIGAELLEANTDLLQAYQPKEYAMIADAFKTTGPWLPYTGILNVFVVNTKKLKPEEYPKTWMDLAQPRFKNLVSFADAEKSGSAYMQLNTFLTIYSDKQPGWDKFKEVYKNMNVSASSGAVPRFVNDGEAVVGITLEDNAYLYLKGGGPVAIIYPEDGTSVIADGMALGQGRAESRRRQGIHRLGAFRRHAEDGGAGARPAADPEGCAAARRAEAARPDQARQVRHQERRRQAQGIHGQVAGACPRQMTFAKRLTRTAGVVPMARVELRRICKSYPGVTALDDVELAVEPGEFFTLLGPSGCGKTTLLRTIAGFNQQDSGEILFDGARIDTVPAHRRDIGMVYQDYAIFPHKSVADNVAFGLTMRRRSAARKSRSASRGRSTSCSSAGTRRGCRTSCRADSSSAWRSPARW